MHPYPRIITAALIALAPAVAPAAWQVISSEPGKRIEIDRGSITRDERGRTVALGRIILDKPIIDPKTSSAYRIVQALSSYDCAARSYSTLKRSYFKEEGQLLREDEVKVQIDMPVRSGMLDDKLLREVCRPKPGGEAATAARRTADKVNEATGELRKANEALLQNDVRRANLQTQPAAVDKPEPEMRRAPHLGLGLIDCRRLGLQVGTADIVLQQRLVRLAQLASGLVDLVGGAAGGRGRFTARLRPAYLAQQLVVEHSRANRHVDLDLDLILPQQLAFFLEVAALEGAVAARRAVVAAERLHDAVSRRGLGIDDRLVEDDSPEGNGSSPLVARDAAAVDLDPLARLGRDHLPGSRRHCRCQGDQSGGDDSGIWVHPAAPLVRFLHH